VFFVSKVSENDESFSWCQRFPSSLILPLFLPNITDGKCIIHFANCTVVDKDIGTDLPDLTDLPILLTLPVESLYPPKIRLDKPLPPSEDSVVPKIMVDPSSLPSVKITTPGKNKSDVVVHYLDSPWHLTIGRYGESFKTDKIEAFIDDNRFCLPMDELLARVEYYISSESGTVCLIHPGVCISAGLYIVWLDDERQTHISVQASDVALDTSKIYLIFDANDNEIMRLEFLTKEAVAAIRLKQAQEPA
jgi:hypothetical protein